MRDRRRGERRKHMPDSVPRTCAEIISNEGTEHRAAESYQERECGLDAEGYCTEDAMYVCATHEQANHSLHEVARR
jgi:hypothetical protein